MKKQSEEKRDGEGYLPRASQRTIKRRAREAFIRKHGDVYVDVPTIRTLKFMYTDPYVRFVRIKLSEILDEPSARLR